MRRTGGEGGMEDGAGPRLGESEEGASRDRCMYAWTGVKINAEGRGRCPVMCGRMA